jgi:hypothetical protein
MAFVNLVKKTVMNAMPTVFVLNAKKGICSHLLIKTLLNVSHVQKIVKPVLNLSRIVKVVRKATYSNLQHVYQRKKSI